MVATPGAATFSWYCRSTAFDLPHEMCRSGTRSVGAVPPRLVRRIRSRVIRRYSSVVDAAVAVYVHHAQLRGERVDGSAERRRRSGPLRPEDEPFLACG